MSYNDYDTIYTSDNTIYIIRYFTSSPVFMESLCPSLRLILQWPKASVQYRRSCQKCDLPGACQIQNGASWKIVTHIQLSLGPREAMNGRFPLLGDVFQ